MRLVMWLGRCVPRKFFVNIRYVGRREVFECLPIETRLICFLSVFELNTRVIITYLNNSCVHIYIF